MPGRWNTSRSNQNLQIHKWYREYYSAIHEVEVDDVHMDDGTVTVRFPNGGDPLKTPFPILGASVPAGESTTPDYRSASWGMYFPQKGDRLLLAFDVRGQPYTFGYSNYKYRDLNRWDIATEERGGIGWGKTSGKLLQPGDWSFKSSRNSAFYLGNKASITSGSMSLTLDNPNKEFKTRADLFVSDYGTNSQSRLGAIKRFQVPGVDLQESYIRDASTGFPGQEYSQYVRRPSIAIPNGILAVRSSMGDVIDDVTVVVPSPPSIFIPALAMSLTGTATRILRQVFDDALGKIPMWNEVVDNFGNYGIEANAATGLGWNTPVATWTVNNLNTSWNSRGLFDLSVTGAYTTKVLGLYTLDVTAAAMLESKALMTLKAPTLALASSNIILGASPCTLTCSSILTLLGTQVILGAAPEPLLKGATFNAAMGAFLGVLAAQFGGLATAAATPPLTPLAAAFTTMATAAGVMSSALAGALTVTTKAG